MAPMRDFPIEEATHEPHVPNSCSTIYNFHFAIFNLQSLDQVHGPNARPNLEIEAFHEPQVGQRCPSAPSLPWQSISSRYLCTKIASARTSLPPWLHHSMTPPLHAFPACTRLKLI